jgi:hypothetical protein
MHGNIVFGSWEDQNHNISKSRANRFMECVILKKENHENTLRITKPMRM